jgi:hypothetical protein
MTMAEMISPELSFTGGQGLVLFHPALPQRHTMTTVPWVEVQVEPPDVAGSPARKRSETFCYGRNGSMDRQEKKGLLIDSYF